SGPGSLIARELKTTTGGTPAASPKWFSEIILRSAIICFILPLPHPAADKPLNPCPVTAFLMSDTGKVTPGKGCRFRVSLSGAVRKIIFMDHLATPEGRMVPGQPPPCDAPRGRGVSIPALKGRPKVNGRYAAEGLNSYKVNRFRYESGQNINRN